MEQFGWINVGIWANSPCVNCAKTSQILPTKGYFLQLTFTYTRARADVTYEVQTTVDLTFPWSATGVTQGTPDVNGVTTATVPLATPARFLRLQVTLAP